MTWHDGLSDEYRGNETLANIPDLDTMAKSYIDSQSYIGGAIRIPSDEAGEEDWAAFNQKLTDKVPGLINLPSNEDDAKAALYARLGRPESADAYSAAAELGGDQAKWLEWAYENGLSDSQVNAWLTKNKESQLAQSDQDSASSEEAMADLHREWGHAFDKKLSDAKQAVLAYADEDTQQFLADSGMAEHPGMIKLMAAIGATLTEEQSAALPSGNQFTMSPAEAQAKLSDIYNNRSHPYFSDKASVRQAAIQEVAKLNQMAYPEAS